MITSMEQALHDQRAAQAACEWLGVSVVYRAGVRWRANLMCPLLVESDWHPTLSAAISDAESRARRFGWTPRRWWQWWRWGEEKRP